MWEGLCEYDGKEKGRGMRILLQQGVWLDMIPYCVKMVVTSKAAAARLRKMKALVVAVPWKDFFTRVAVHLEKHTITN